ncbi:hypothetical protein ABK040_016187 [Willaertia magna]
MNHFSEFPFEIQILILSNCLDDELLILSKCNEFYYKLIIGRSLKNENKTLEELDDNLFQWHEILWKLKLLQFYNKNNSDDKLLLENNILKNYKHHYFIITQLTFEFPNDLYQQLQNLDSSVTKHWTFTKDKKSIENVCVRNWLSFRSNFQMSKKFKNPKLRGYELLIDNYSNTTSNSWIIVFGIGTIPKEDNYNPFDSIGHRYTKKTEYVFNSDRYIAEFLKANKGVGLLCSFMGVKAFDRYFSFESQKPKDFTQSWESIHRVTVFDPLISDEDVYCPVVSLSPGTGVTISSFPSQYSLRDDAIQSKPSINDLTY